jgi:hypothetical protein
MTTSTTPIPTDAARHSSLSVRRQTEATPLLLSPVEVIAAGGYLDPRGRHPNRRKSVGCRPVDKIRETAVKFRHCSPELTAVALIIVAAVVLLSPVLETPFYGDDLHNIQRSAELAAEDQTSWAFIASQNQQWMTNEGRFFPVTFTEITLLFDNVHARWIYKTLQMVAATGAVAVLGTFVAVLSRNRRLGLLVSIVALSGLQIRLWYDPIISYNLMLPSLTITILLSWLILVGGLRSSNRTLTITAFACSGLLWTVGLLQYEITYLLAPAVLAILWHERLTERWRLWAAGGTVLIPTFLLANYVATLRSGATPSPAYTTNFALEDVVPAAIYQLVGAFPGTAAVFAAGVPGIGSLSCAILGALPHVPLRH